MTRVFHFFRIIITFHRYGLLEILKKYNKTTRIAFTLEITLFFIPKKLKNQPLSVRLRVALEQLGPIFIKFGQILSTRHDLLPPEIIHELSKLQRDVPPFDGKIAKAIVKNSLANNLENVFCEWSEEAVASASIAQVHKAKLKQENTYVAVKVLRPNIKNIITKDLKVLKMLAVFLELVFKDGKRLKLKEVIKEFENTIYAEIDFVQEAGNATELRRLHNGDNKIIIPLIYFNYSSKDVLVMEWLDGIPISDIKTLKEKGINLELLSHNGVSIFYTQVFQFGFFHADMHPGNIFCNEQNQYIALDFGIVGCLAEEDKRYLSINLLAFFNRDYKLVAQTHISSGWAPTKTVVEELENAIRAVCEPIFNKPLAEISFGQVLIKLFQISRKFNIPVQPQLILLQKTIINVEGMGRMLNPNLDLWVTAKPILQKWINQNMGVRGFITNLKRELPYLSYSLPKLPRLIVQTLENSSRNNEIQLIKKINILKQFNIVLIIIVLLLIIFLWLKL